MKKSKSGKVSGLSFPWEKLTWDDLSEWTDSRSLELGRSYQRRGAVRNLSLLPDGGLLADVSGTHRYATHASMAGRSPDLSKRLEATCSCPVGHRCKHAVAVILEFLVAIENGTVIPETDDDDRRLTLIENGWEDDLSEGELENEDFDEADSARVDVSVTSVSNSAARKSGPRMKGVARPKRKITDADIVNFLSAKSKDDLVSIVMQVCRGDAKFRQTYADRIMLESGDHAAMIREARKELRSVTSEEAWYNSWEGHGSLPDYSRLRSQLRSLVDAEQFDAVVELGRELIERGMQQVEQSHDEGETAGEIASTLSIVAESIVPSSLPDPDRILFVIDSFMRDDYDLCHSFSDVLDQRYSRSAWADVAENLKSRLPSQMTTWKDRASADFTRSYQRERLSGWIIDALEASGDEAAATDFCIEEATKAGSYQRAVDRLIALKRYDEATELASQGLENTDPTYAGLINRLQDSMATIAAKSKDHSVAAAIAAERFVARPGVSSLQDLLKVARKAKCEAETKAVAMNFLEIGKRPAYSKASKTRAGKTTKRTKPRIDCWPFSAPPGATASNSRLDRGDAKKPRPHFDVLIRLSIQQRDPESVLRWYDRWQASAANNRFRFNRFETEVADAVSSTHPDRAIELYCTEADRLAAETNTKLYPQSISLLKKARKVLKSQKREHEFEGVLTTFHARHHRKRRLVELLHSLGGQPIVNKRRSNK
ncbi:MAG: SWIM zinc finger domain-containing protein [Planctomycetaceae bacterium]|nr:SWIM zinc finger domain-containing protein [Planctomycetaceae bacterium]